MTVKLLAAVAAFGAVLTAAAPVSASLAAQRPSLPGVTETYRGSRSVRIEGPAADERRVELIEGVSFRHGAIEFDIAGEIQPGAHPTVRGFVGLAFNVAGPDTYECVYLRVANGRAESQAMRNRALQYMSHPDYHWRRLREEKAGEYESYADIGEREWIHVRIEVDATRVRTFINGAPRPSLAVDRLPNAGVDGGRVALFVAQGSTGHYRNLTIMPAA